MSQIEELVIGQQGTITVEEIMWVAGAVMVLGVTWNLWKHLFTARPPK